MSKSRFSLRNIRTVGAQREIEDRLARFTNPDPLCPKCGQQVCEHNGKAQEHRRWLAEHPSPGERR